MKKVEFTDSETFERVEVEYDEFHCQLAEEIVNIMQHLHKSTPIMYEKEGKKIMIGIMKDRTPGGAHAEKFKITIERINEKGES